MAYKTYTIEGYIYANISEAEAAIESLNSHFGFPISPDSVTQNYTSYSTIDDIIHILASEKIKAVLGDTVEIEFFDRDIDGNKIEEEEKWNIICQ